MALKDHGQTWLGTSSQKSGDSLAWRCETIEDQKGITEAHSDTHDSLGTHRTNEVIRALTVISVIMLPLTLVSGIYGMNVPLPLAHYPGAFEVILLLMALVAASMLAFFRRKNWT